MTYGVPYSFVPGTKAKADEVNANFIEILNKIDTTNSRIDGNDSSLNELNNSLDELDNSLDELNNSIDGQWIKSENFIITSDTAMSAGQVRTYDLSSYLPNDGNIYEILGSTTGKTSSSIIDIGIGSAFTLNIYRVCSYTTSSNSSSFIVPIGTDRKIRLANLNTDKTGTCVYFRLFAYRKVR